MIEKLKNNIIAQLKAFQESRTYIALEEGYDRLQPAHQQMVKIGSGLTTFVVVFLIILSLFSGASTKIKDFDESRTLISELNNLQTKLISSPIASTPPERNALVRNIRSTIERTNVTSSQIGSIRSTNIKGDIKKTSLDTEGIEIKLKTLNLTQITNVASRIQNISRSIKVVSVDITESKEGPGYFDVNYKVAAFYPKIAKVENDDDEKDNKRKKRKKRRKKIRKPPKDDKSDKDDEDDNEDD